MNHDNCQKVLHQDAYGYVAHCTHCRDFQVAFGTFYINQTLPDLQQFAEIIARHYDRYQYSCRGKQRKLRYIQLCSPYPGFGLLFSVQDLEQLNHILQKTLLILATQDEVRLQ